MKRIPSKVVAAPGYSASVDIGKRGIKLTSFEPVNLLEYFTKEEIQQSDSLREAFRQGWVVAFKGQELPKKSEPKIKIPDMRVSQNPSSAKIKIVEKKNKGRESDYGYETEIPEATQTLIKDAADNQKRKKLEEKEELLKSQKEKFETDVVISKGKVDIPKITTVRIDGKEVMNWKAVKKGKKPVEENKIKVDLQEKTVTEEE
jgi:hypothetical protein